MEDFVSLRELPPMIRFRIYDTYKEKGKIMAVRYLRGEYEDMSFQEARELVGNTVQEIIASKLVLGCYHIHINEDGSITLLPK